jgi:hypothetical protein
MSKLFAMEELETDLPESELEVSPEEGEVADVQVQVEQEVSEVADDSAAIDEGIEAADQLEQVEEVVSSAAEEGEGLDPVAAEAIKIAVEAICARVGANPKTVYALYATENFQSASSRKANTKIALEGIGDFLKNLWTKIKTALLNLRAKAKAFFEKYFTTMGRVKEALKSSQVALAKTSGEVKGDKYIKEAPSSLVDAFGVLGDVKSSSIEGFIKAHVEADKVALEIASSGVVFASKAVETVKAGKTIKADFDDSLQFELGTESKPLVGGLYIKYKLESVEDSVIATLEKETVKKPETAGIFVDSKDALKTLLKSVSQVVADASKNKESFTKREEEFSKAMKEMEKLVNEKAAAKDSDDSVKELNKAIKLIYKTNTKTPTILTEKIALDLKLAKGVLGYTSFCMKHYK